MCNTRLLQANLKLHIALLDSVVDILSGLRSAFFEIMHTPEALAAAATISAKQAGKQQSATARPLQASAPGSAQPQFANTRYATQQAAPLATAAAMAKAGVKPAPPLAASPVAPLSPASPESVEALTKAQAALADVQIAQDRAAPAAPQPDAPPVSGFAGKRVAAYGRIMHVK